MPQTNPSFDDEIDLFELFYTLWDGKWKIIATSFVAAVIGFSFSVLKPNSYEVSTSIQIGNQSVFLKYTSLNNLLKSEGLLYEAEKNPNGYIFDSASIFKMFIAEFNDYEEMVDAVGTSEFVQKSIKDLDVDSKQKALINFAKAFELKALSENNWALSFEWHDELEGARLFNDAIRHTLSNTKNLSVASVNDLADAIDVQNEQELEKLSYILSQIEENQNIRNKKRVQYLYEQSAIAKELGIETNRLDANNLSQITQSTISLGVNPSDTPYYLRGYKAIEKEIALIQSRSKEENLLNSDDYIITSENIALIQNDFSSSQLRGASEIIANDNVNDWVNFNFAIADVKSQKNSSFYLTLSMALGGMVGVMYVLISNTFRKRKQNLANA